MVRFSGYRIYSTVYMYSKSHVIAVYVMKIVCFEMKTHKVLLSLLGSVVGKLNYLL